MEKIIEIKDLSKIYTRGEENVYALNNISLSVDKGDYLAIVGKSGSGKSTLMNMIGCIDSPTYGSYILNGENVYNLSDKELSYIRNKEIGFIFQGFNLIKSLSAVENVELPLFYRGVAKKKRREIAMDALEKVDLSHRISHRPHELSGGQQQRVAIARAIAASPAILLADEPTGNLDSLTGKEVLSLIGELSNKGVTIIMITHDDSIAKNAKKVIMLNDGVLTHYSS